MFFTGFENYQKYHANCASMEERMSIEKKRMAQSDPIISINVVTPGYIVNAMYKGSRSAKNIS